MHRTGVLRLLQLNLWNLSGDAPARRTELSAILQHHQPDICCFQETVLGATGVSHEHVWEPLGYQTFHAPLPTWPGAVVNGGSTGNTIVSRLPMLKRQVFELPAGPWPEERNVAAAAVDVGLGRSLHILNTHLAWRPEDDQTRTRQVRAVIDQLLPPSRSRDVIICGDLNTTPGTPSLELLLANGFTDAWAQHGLGPGYTWAHQNPNMGLTAEYDRRIDYILLANGLRCRTIEMVGVSPITGASVSDHFGLVAEVEL